ncbi:hypothetical protein Tco_0490153 [Tanacetum coccineum]
MVILELHVSQVPGIPTTNNQQEEIAFLAEPRTYPDIQYLQTSFTPHAAYQADDLDAYDSDLLGSVFVKERTTATSSLRAGTWGSKTFYKCQRITASGNTKNDRILQTPSSNSKNKVEAHPRNVKSSLNKKNGTVNVNGSAVVQNLKKQDNSDYVCIHRDDSIPSQWCTDGTFTIVGNACPLTRITTTNEVPSRKPIVLDSESPKPVVKLVYSRKPRKNKNAESVSKTKVLQPMSANKKEPSKSWGSTNTNIPSTSLNECMFVQIVLWYLDSGCSKHMTGDRSQAPNFVSKFLGTVKFGNDQVA